MNSEKAYREVQRILKILETRNLGPEEWARAERLCADDPFLQDTLEGLKALDPEKRGHHLVSLNAKLRKIYFQPQAGRVSIGFLVGAAAAVALLIGAFWFLPDQVAESDQVAMHPTPPEGGTAPVSETRISLTEDEESIFADKPVGSTSSSVSASNETVTTDGEMQDLARTSGTSAPNVRTPEPKTDDSDMVGREASEEFNRAGLMKAEPSATRPNQMLNAQENELNRVNHVSGLILDPTGFPLPDAVVEVKGSLLQSVTDGAGNFAMQVPDTSPDQALLITHAGYGTVETSVRNNSQVVLQLKEQPAGREKKSFKFIDQTPVNLGQRALSQPADGERSYQKYIRQNLRFPDEARTQGIKGTVVVEFEVESSGTPVNIRIVESLGYGCDQESIRLIREGPKWTTIDAQVLIGRREIEF
jgi:TonB family protein